MPDNPTSNQNQGHWWTKYFVPTVGGLEGFLWRVAWFVVLLKLLAFI
jgi:hypothetical protein